MQKSCCSQEPLVFSTRIDNIFSQVSGLHSAAASPRDKELSIHFMRDKEAFAAFQCRCQLVNHHLLQRFSADIQGHVIAINDSLHESHPFGYQVVKFFDEDPGAADGVQRKQSAFQEKKTA